MPLVNKQLRHDRVQTLSLGLNSDEKPVGTPHKINWASHLPETAGTGPGAGSAGQPGGRGGR